MPGNGTIGGGGSVEFDFKIKKKGAGPGDPPNQHWKGTDPDSAIPAPPNTPATACKVTVTFNKQPTEVSKTKYEIDLAAGEKNVVVIDWD